MEDQKKVPGKKSFKKGMKLEWYLNFRTMGMYVNVTEEYEYRYGSIK